ncbi:MAG TPA: glycosyltransferase [Cyclobacteriaceae bacterium]
MKKILIVGPCYPFRGGIANLNDMLGVELMKQGHEVVFLSFSLQYPKLLFPGKSQFAEKMDPPRINVNFELNSISFINWILKGKKYKGKYDLIIVRYWTPFLSPCLGTFCRMVRHKKTKIIGLIDNILPHERKLFDKILAKYFLNSLNASLALSKSVAEEVKKIYSRKDIAYTHHPIYNNYGDALDRDKAIEYLKLSKNYRYLLFFGLVRHYKGLDLLLKAFSKLDHNKYRLLVVGEFYEDKQKYLRLINDLNLDSYTTIFDYFIPDDEVKYFFSVADLAVQPYRTATQSGISKIALHFEKPILVTDVGGLSETIDHLKDGIISKVNETDIANWINYYFDNQMQASMAEHIKKRKDDFSWDHLISKIFDVYESN